MSKYLKKKFTTILGKKNIAKNILKIICLIFLFLLTCIYSLTYFIKPNIEQIAYSNTVFDTNNVIIGEIIKDNKYRHSPLIFEDIPDFTKKAIISLEDRTFYTNSGIDYTAIIRAFFNNLKTGNSIEGASTISSQVIRNNYWLNDERTISKKIKEFYLSIALNNHYSKDEILNNYLSNIYFGYLNYGLNSASKYYFGKDIKTLTKAEQIALISIPKNPKKYDPYTNRIEFKTRFKFICSILLQNKIIDSSEFSSILNEKLTFNENHENKLPYIIDYLKYIKVDTVKNTDLKTTIDYNLTKKINEIGKISIIPLIWKNVKDYSIIIIDKETMELKVMIGGINYYGNDGQVSMITSPRQVGSTIKPFTYVLAFKNLGFTPQTTILDLPTQFNTSLGYAYNPKNYSLNYKGEVSIAEALSQSINIVALKVAEKVGVKNLLDFLKKLGITSLNRDENYYGLALTLGVGEINLLELTKAYTVFANDGKLCDLKIIKDSNGNKCKQIIEKKYTDMINYILTNRYFKLYEFPINGNLDFPDKTVFLKTGTSRNFKDNWTIGYSSKYIIGVWAGNKDGSEMKGVSGASGAGEIFKNVIDYLEQNTNKNPIIKIKKEQISYLEITSPLNNSKYKIDNLKQKETQKIKLEFSTNLVYDNFKWFDNNKEVKGNFIELEKGKKEIKLILFGIDGSKIKEEQSFIFSE